MPQYLKTGHHGTISCSVDIRVAQFISTAQPGECRSQNPADETEKQTEPNYTADIASGRNGFANSADIFGAKTDERRTETDQE